MPFRRSCRGRPDRGRDGGRGERENPVIPARISTRNYLDPPISAHIHSFILFQPCCTLSRLQECRVWRGHGRVPEQIARGKRNFCVGLVSTQHVKPSWPPDSEHVRSRKKYARDVLRSLSRGKCQEIGGQSGIGSLAGKSSPWYSRALFVAGEVGVGSCTVESQVYVYGAPLQAKLSSPSCAIEMWGMALRGVGRCSANASGVGEGGGFRRLGARKGIPAPQFFQPVPDWLFLLARRVFDHATSLALFCLGRFLLHFAPVVPRGFAFPIGPGHSRRFVMEIVPAGDAGWHHVPGDALYERLGKR